MRHCPSAWSSADNEALLASIVRALRKSGEGIRLGPPPDRGLGRRGGCSPGLRLGGGKRIARVAVVGAFEPPEGGGGGGGSGKGAQTATPKCAMAFRLMDHYCRAPLAAMQPATFAGGVPPTPRVLSGPYNSASEDRLPSVGSLNPKTPQNPETKSPGNNDNVAFGEDVACASDGGGFTV